MFKKYKYVLTNKRKVIDFRIGKISTIFCCFKLLSKMPRLSLEELERAIGMLQDWLSSHRVTNWFNCSHTTTNKVTLFWCTQKPKLGHFVKYAESDCYTVPIRFLSTTGSTRQFCIFTGRVISARTMFLRAAEPQCELYWISLKFFLCLVLCA